MNRYESRLEDMIAHEMIALRAHQLWVARGCPLGDPERDWFAARGELERELSPNREPRTMGKRAA